MSTINIGKNAESLAVKFLKKQGLVIVAQNYRCRFGEIDIVASADSTLVFVEVRKRKNLSSAIDSVDLIKQKKLSITAAHYLSHYHCENICRFDTLVIDDSQNLQWIKNAFDANF